MNIAILKDGVCVNAAVFENIETAREFLALGVWPEVDAVLELPDGYGIGDSVEDGEWVRPELPDDPPDTPPEPDYMAFIAGLMEGYANG